MAGVSQQGQRRACRPHCSMVPGRLHQQSTLKKRKKERKEKKALPQSFPWTVRTLGSSKSAQAVSPVSQAPPNDTFSGQMPQTYGAVIFSRTPSNVGGSGGGGMLFLASAESLNASPSPLLRLLRHSCVVTEKAGICSIFLAGDRRTQARR